MACQSGYANQQPDNSRAVKSKVFFLGKHRVVEYAAFYRTAVVNTTRILWRAVKTCAEKMSDFSRSGIHEVVGCE